MTDTERLDWLIERLTAERAPFALAVLGLPRNALEGAGDETIGNLFRKAVDREMASRGVD